MDKPIYLVAGASSGMGRATALYLAKHGAHVIVASRREEACVEVAEAISEAGGSASPQAFDGTDAQSAADLIAWIESEFGVLNGAFNNLGDTIGDGPLHEMPLDRWRASLAVNLDAVFHLMRAEIPLLLKSGGGAMSYGAHWIAVCLLAQPPIALVGILLAACVLANLPLAGADCLLLPSHQWPLLLACPIGWSGLIVSVSFASGLSGRCFAAQVADTPTSCVA